MPMNVTSAINGDRCVPNLFLWKKQFSILCGLQKQGRVTRWMTTITPGPVV